MPKVAFRSAKGRLPRDSLSRSESRKTSGRRAPSAILFVAFVAFCSNSFLEQKQTKETKNTFETGNPQDRRALAEGCRLRCRLATNPRMGFPCLADLPHLSLLIRGIRAIRGQRIPSRHSRQPTYRLTTDRTDTTDQTGSRAKVVRSAKERLPRGSLSRSERRQTSGRCSPSAPCKTSTIAVRPTLLFRVLPFLPWTIFLSNSWSLRSPLTEETDDSGSPRFACVLAGGHGISRSSRHRYM